MSAIFYRSTLGDREQSNRLSFIQRYSFSRGQLLRLSKQAPFLERLRTIVVMKSLATMNFIA